MPRVRRRSENDSDTSIDNNPVAGMEGYSSGFLELQTDDGGPRDRSRSAEKKGKTRKSKESKDSPTARGKVRKGTKSKSKRAPPEEDDVDDITVSMSLRDESPQRFPGQAVPRDDADRYYLRSPAPAEIARDPAAKAQPEVRSRAVVPRAVRLSHTSPSRPEPAAPPHAIPHLSPWLNDRLAGEAKRDGSAKVQKRNTVTDTGDLDAGRNEEIRALQEKVDDLVCESKLRETERQLDLLRQINRSQKDENQKLQQDLVNKERHVLELQSEVDNLDKVISVKSALRESDTIQELQERLDRTQVELDRAAHDANAKDRQISYYQNEVEKRDREMQHKNRRIDDLQMEVEDMRDMVAVKNRQAAEAAEKAKAAERQAQGLQDEAARSNDLKVQLQDARDEIVALQERCNELEGEVETLQRQQDSQQDLQSVVDDLRQVVSENNMAEKERQQMDDQLRRTEGLLKERAAEEEGQRRANEQLRQYCAELERENKFLRETEKEQRAARAQRDQSERARAEAERKEDELRARLAGVQDKCLEKDGLIKRLADELRARGDYLQPALSPKGRDALPALVEESTPRRAEEPFHRSAAAPQEASLDPWGTGPPTEGAMPRDELAELVRLNTRSPRDREALARAKVTSRR